MLVGGFNQMGEVGCLGWFAGQLVCSGGYAGYLGWITGQLIY